MPLTPAHIGPAVLIGSIGGKKLNLTALVLSATLIDIEVLILGIRNDYIFTHHGFFHTLLGASVFAFILTGTLFFLSTINLVLSDVRNKDIGLYKHYREMNIRNWQWSLKCLFMSSLLGAYSHIGMDWLFYPDIRNFAVADINIYHDFIENEVVIISVYSFCIISFIAGALIYAARRLTYKNRDYEITSVNDISFKFSYLWTVFALILTPFSIAGINIFISITSVFTYNPDMRAYISFLFDNMAPMLIFTCIIIILMSVFYYKALKAAGWKLFE